MAQTLVGAATEHYRADMSNFFGLDLARVLPYNLARTWHVQLALFWTAAAFLAGGIFLVPFIARREPRRQSWLVYGLLGAVAVVVWGMNLELAWMVFATLLPLGVLQLFHSVNDGYYEARSLGYITRPGNALLEWLRMPGDLIFIVGGVLPFIYIAWLALRHFRSGPVADELPEHPLYTDTVAEGAEAAAPAKE